MTELTEQMNPCNNHPIQDLFSGLRVCHTYLYWGLTEKYLYNFLWNIVSTRIYDGLLNVLFVESSFTSKGRFANENISILLEFSLAVRKKNLSWRFVNRFDNTSYECLYIANFECYLFSWLNFHPAIIHCSQRTQ